MIQTFMLDNSQYICQHIGMSIEFPTIFPIVHQTFNGYIFSHHPVIHIRPCKMNKAIFVVRKQMIKRLYLSALLHNNIANGG